MAKFQMTELVPSRAPVTARLGAGTTSANHVGDEELGKAVKLVADSRYDLCAAGDPIEGFINSVEPATADDYTIGSVQLGDRKAVTADGLEATPGTGVIAVGDYVVMGTAVAKGTALVFGTPNKVTKATYQPGTAIVSDVAGGDTAADIKTMLDLEFVKRAAVEALALYPWKVVSLGSAGTGAVGTGIVIEKTY